MSGGQAFVFGARRVQSFRTRDGFARSQGFVALACELFPWNGSSSDPRDPRDHHGRVVAIYRWFRAWRVIFFCIQIGCNNRSILTWIIKQKQSARPFYCKSECVHKSTDHRKCDNISYRLLTWKLKLLRSLKWTGISCTVILINRLYRAATILRGYAVVQVVTKWFFHPCGNKPDDPYWIPKVDKTRIESRQLYGIVEYTRQSIYISRTVPWC